MSDSTDPTNPDDTSAENFAALRGKNEELERRLAFTEALGGDFVRSTQGNVLMQTFTGKLEPDAIKAYRDELFPAAASPAATPTPTPDPAQEPADQDPYAKDVAGQQAIRDSFAGAGAPGQVDAEAPPQNVHDLAASQYHSERRSGVPQERAALGAIDMVIAAAASGEPTALFDSEDWSRQKAEAGHRPRAMTEA